MAALLSTPTAPTAPTAAPVRRDAAVRSVAGGLLWLAMLLPTYWWVADRGLQDLAGWESALTSLGRLLGLWASVLLLAQVVLMARVPWLERAFGQDRMVRLHRLVGFTSFDLMAAHIVLLTWGYAAGRLPGTPATLWDLSVHYPGMLLAVAGTACVVMVGVTSVKAARRRLRYESWHLMHLYAYLGVGLALPHQLWTGQAFLARPAATVFWWTIWALAAAAVLVFRVGAPIALNLRHRLRVTALVPEAPGVVSVWISGRRLDRLRVEPGQFFTWRFLGRHGWTRANPYSLSAAPDGSFLRLTVQDVGDGSGSLGALGRGTRVVIEGPFGRLSPRVRTRRPVLLAGAGVGIAPLRALADGLRYRPGDAVLLHRYHDVPVFQAEFETLAVQRGLRVVGLAGPRRAADSWLGAHAGISVPLPAGDAAALLALVPDLAERDAFVCGPAAWTESLRRAALAAGLPAEQFHEELFAW